jgi:hypothetical protein
MLLCRSVLLFLVHLGCGPSFGRLCACAQGKMCLFVMCFASWMAGEGAAMCRVRVRNAELLFVLVRGIAIVSRRAQFSRVVQ